MYEYLVKLIISIFATIVLITAIITTVDKAGDKSNGWAWKCGAWIIISLLEIWR